MSQICHLRNSKSQSSSPEPAHFHQLQPKCPAPAGSGSTTMPLGRRGCAVAGDRWGHSESPDPSLLCVQGGQEHPD